MSDLFKLSFWIFFGWDWLLFLLLWARVSREFSLFLDFTFSLDRYILRVGCPLHLFILFVLPLSCLPLLDPGSFSRAFLNLRQSKRKFVVGHTSSCHSATMITFLSLLKTLLICVFSSCSLFDVTPIFNCQN